MKKQFKKALSMVLSAAMVVTLGSGLELKTTKAATLKTYTASLVARDTVGGTVWDDAHAFTSGDVATVDLSDSTTEYTVTATTTTELAPDLMYLSIPKLGADLTDAGLTVDDYTVTIKSLKVDGNDVEVTVGEGAAYNKIEGAELQFVINNAYDPAVGFDASANKASEEIEVVFTISINGEVDGVTTGTAVTTTGNDPTEEPEEPGDIIEAKEGMAILSGAWPGHNDSYYYDDANQGGQGIDYTLDVDEVDGPGQYTVGIDFAEPAADLQTLYLQIIGVEQKNPDSIIRVDEILVDGEAIAADRLDEVFTYSEDKPDYLNTRVNLYNQWAGTPEDYTVEGKTTPRKYDGDLDNADSMIIEDFVDENEDYESIEVSFTYGTKAQIDAIDAGEDPTKPEATDTPAPDTTGTPAPDTTGTPAPDTTGTPAPGTSATGTPAPGTSATKAPTNTNTGLATGKTQKVGGVTYKATSANAVEYKAAKKNVKTATIPATVTINGKKYKVTSIAAKAFANNKKLTKVTIGANVTKIGKQAFFKCPKLKTIIFKGTKVKTIGAKAFAKGNKKPTVTVPKKAFKTLKKKLTKAGLSKKAKYKKK